MSDYRWADDESAVDLDELSSLYRIAPLGHKEPARGPVMGDQGDPVSLRDERKIGRTSRVASRAFRAAAPKCLR